MPKKASIPKKTTKKVTKKAAVKKAKKKATKKKTAAKKRPSKHETRRKVRKNAPENKVFVMVNGHEVKNIKDLADKLEKIEDYVFNHHVSEDKNDFAVWLHDVFEEIELAKNISGAKDKQHVQLVLYKHISHKLW